MGIPVQILPVLSEQLEQVQSEVLKAIGACCSGPHWALLLNELTHTLDQASSTTFYFGTCCPALSLHASSGSPYYPVMAAVSQATALHEWKSFKPHPPFEDYTATAHKLPHWKPQILVPTASRLSLFLLYDWLLVLQIHVCRHLRSKALLKSQAGSAAGGCIFTTNIHQ